MSAWTEITDINDLDIDGDDLNILYFHDESGSKFIGVPIAMLLEKLREARLIEERKQ